MKKCLLFLLPVLLSAFSCGRDDMPATDRTRALVRELLVKLDSTEMYASRREREIDSLKASLAGTSGQARYDICSAIAEEYSNYIADSSLTYWMEAVRIASDACNDSLRINAEFAQAQFLSSIGFFTEAYEILQSIPRNELRGENFIAYYESMTNLYHGLYSGTDELEKYRVRYRSVYNEYRDSLLAVADTTSEVYLRNMERKEARAGNFDKAREYNARRFGNIRETGPRLNATRLYDNFAIAYLYECKLTGEAVDNLLESAIIEVEASNQDIASLLRVEQLLFDNNEIKAAKKVSDYYYSTMQKLGSRLRRLNGIDQTIKINDQNFLALGRKNRYIWLALGLISVLVIIMGLLLVITRNSFRKIKVLNDNLETAGKISKGYVGVFFQQYSLYIKRMEEFRVKIHSNLKRRNVEQALLLTSPSDNSSSSEIKEMNRNFDSAFLEIFPDFVQQVNACLKPEAAIIPKKTEMLNTELRILALQKLGFTDTAKISELLHCSIKTVYNKRSEISCGLAVPKEEFEAMLSKM